MQALRLGARKPKGWGKTRSNETPTDVGKKGGWN